MTVQIEKSKAKGIVNAPPSKSVAHRLLIAAGLCEGTSVVKGLALSQDILATMDCLKALGARVTYEGDTATVTGADPKKAKNALLPCRESGSTLRFFLPLCLLGESRATLTGSDRLMERPQGVYEALCQEKGLLFEKQGKAITVAGPLNGGEYTLPGDVSSQFVTGLLYALPLTGVDSTITLTGKVESRSYIDLTLQALGAFGIDAGWQDDNRLFVTAGCYHPQTLRVEGDYSNAAFLDALGVIGGEVTVTGLSENSLQGDRVYRKAFSALKKGCPELSLADCPDLGPILMALAAVFHGGVFTHTARLKIKESDRGKAMARELKKFGIQVDVEENRIVVHKGALTPPTEPLFGHNDHRIVMSVATLCTLTGGVIEDAGAIAKSYPDYFEQIGTLGIQWKEVNTNGIE